MAEVKFPGGIPTKEVNGFIWAWHHLLKEDPYFELPVIEGFNGDDEKWSKVFEYEYKINTVLQEIAENDVDQAHFPKVHGSPRSFLSPYFIT